MDNYKIFYRTFLAEMPWVVDGSNAFEAQRQMLEELLSDGSAPEQLGKDVYKLTSGNQTTYWIGSADAAGVSIIVDTEINGNFCKVVLTSKNPAIAPKSPPFASDLYLLIKQDLSTLNLVFTSDGMLSSDAVKLWTRIMNQGENISVYDTQKSQYVLNPVKTVDQLSNYLGDYNNSRYVFVLSETAQEFKGVAHSIALMELKRSARYPLQELFDHLKRKKQQ
jgi:hypothetical protein